MKEHNLDYFKILILIFLFGLLYCFYLYTQNGRYTNTANVRVVLDTRTGNLKIPIIEEEK